jgi:hypothetical protein
LEEYNEETEGGKNVMMKEGERNVMMKLRVEGM